MADIAKMIEDIKGMTVLELNELVKAIENEFGVSAAAPAAVAVAAAPAAGAAAAAHGRHRRDVLQRHGGGPGHRRAGDEVVLHVGAALRGAAAEPGDGRAVL